MPSEIGLSPAEVASIISLLEAGPSRSFEWAWRCFGGAFPSVVDELRGSLALAALFRFQDFLPRPSQRLHLLWILHQLNVAADAAPFTPLFVALAKVGEENNDLVRLSQPERHFTLHLMAGGAAQFAKSDPRSVLAAEGPSPKVDLAALERSARDSQGPWAQLRLFPALDDFPDRTWGRQEPADPLRRTLEELMGPGGVPPALRSLGPAFARPPPPIHSGEDEFVWLDSIEASQFVPLFDEDMLLDDDGDEEEESSTADTSAKDTDSRDTADKEPPSPASSATSSPSRKPPPDADATQDWDPVLMLNKALTTQLMINQANWLCERVKEDTSLMAAVGMSPEKLPSLVEANPSVAVVVLLNLINDAAGRDTYFGTLVVMEVTVHGMEVVNRLTHSVELPSEFMHGYVCNCIRACEGERDSSLAQNRLVRLVCVFVQAMVRNRVFAFSKELRSELQGFCLNFSRIKEAAALYKMVQSASKEEQESARVD